MGEEKLEKLREACNWSIFDWYFSSGSPEMFKNYS